MYTPTTAYTPQKEAERASEMPENGVIISSEDEALAYLAKVLVEAYLEQKNYVPLKQSAK